MELVKESSTANPAGSPKFQELEKDEPDYPWDRFEDFVKKIAQVPKEEVNELRIEREQKKRRPE